jgi:hypothetical protein
MIDAASPAGIFRRRAPAVCCIGLQCEPGAAYCMVRCGMLQRNCAAMVNEEPVRVLHFA